MKKVCKKLLEYLISQKPKSSKKFRLYYLNLFTYKNIHSNINILQINCILITNNRGYTQGCHRLKNYVAK